MSMVLRLKRLESHSHARYPVNPLYKGQTIRVDDAFGESLLKKGTTGGPDGEFMPYFEECPKNSPAQYEALAEPVNDRADPNKVTLSREEYEALVAKANSKPPRPVMEDAGGEEEEEEGATGQGDGTGEEASGEGTGSDTTPTAPTQRVKPAAKTASRRRAA